MNVLKEKVCKECGMIFKPVSNKQKYCSKEHYRPCPVCGKLVFAKYLSDPARCCSGVCKSALGKLNKEGKSPEYANKVGTCIDPAVVSYIKADAESVMEVFNDAGTQDNPIDSNDGCIRKKYIGDDIAGWIQGHEYSVTVLHEGKEHVVAADYDFTAKRRTNLTYRFTNKKKISTIFRACKEK